MAKVPENQAQSRSAKRPRNKTAEQILDLAELLIQTRGYSAFSYRDISEALGIRKASIHYHFPSKSDLGAAVVDRYAERFATALAVIAKDTSKSSMDMLDRYTEPYKAYADTPDRVCLCGALAGEILALPPVLREKVEQFFKQHQDWLAQILRRGADSGEFTLPAPPEKMARVVFGALQGALLVKRTTGDAAQLQDVICVLKSQIVRGNNKSQ